MMSFVTASGAIVEERQNAIIPAVAGALMAGEHCGGEGIGGYLLICDATRADVVSALRYRKMRPRKPWLFCIRICGPHNKMWKLTAMRKLVAFTSFSHRTVSFKIPNPGGIAIEEVAPGLAHLGVMLPYSPLLALISDHFQKAACGNQCQYQWLPNRIQRQTSL